MLSQVSQKIPASSRKWRGSPAETAPCDALNIPHGARDFPETGLHYIRMRNTPGWQVLENFLSPQHCDAILASIDRYRHQYDVPLIYREELGRSLKYQVIHGEEIRGRLAAIQSLYEEMLRLVQRMTGEQVVPLRNSKVGVNVNITPPGGMYRWHYDRNAVTAILYLNEVSGGETEAYPHYRLLLAGARSSQTQNYLDRLLRTGLMLRIFGRKQTLAPKPGLLVIMRGDRCLHSVRPVSGSDDRICIVMSFDSPEATFPQEVALDSYLYSSQASVDKRDPNYAPK
jgi:hypothetical protein